MTLSPSHKFSVPSTPPLPLSFLPLFLSFLLLLFVYSPSPPSFFSPPSLLWFSFLSYSSTFDSYRIWPFFFLLLFRRRERCVCMWGMTVSVYLGLRLLQIQNPVEWMGLGESLGFFSGLEVWECHHTKQFKREDSGKLVSISSGDRER